MDRHRPQALCRVPQRRRRSPRPPPPEPRTSAYLLVVSGDLHTEEGNLGEAAADYLKVINFHEDADFKPFVIWKYIGVLEKQGNAAEAAKVEPCSPKEFPDRKVP